ncbi:MAG TPA: homoserine O-succinyltransferase [Roseiarcus sp.]|jgi:homoserine O-succinyltransferase
MPVVVERAPLPSPVADLRERRTRRGSLHDRGKRIEIGLVNNMPDAAVAATARQFVRLVDAASGEFDVRLRLFDLETLPRGGEARRAMAEEYRSTRTLRLAPLDALIVTGAEPRAADLAQEPFWRELSGLLEWAGARTISTVLSCLAAHAEALRRDGVARRKLAAKRSGVFSIRIVEQHELLEGFDAEFVTPHSRHNDLDEAELVAKGYAILARSAEAGADLFVKEANSLLVFLQGHPEYDADTLAREYRRDMLRFLRGEAAVMPRAPANYFPAPVAAALKDFAAAAVSQPGSALASDFPAAALAMNAAPWRAAANRLFGNWLATIARRKVARDSTSFAVARWGG